MGQHAELLLEHGYAVRVLAGRGGRFNRQVPVDPPPGPGLQVPGPARRQRRAEGRRGHRALRGARRRAARPAPRAPGGPRRLHRPQRPLAALQPAADRGVRAADRRGPGAAAGRLVPRPLLDQPALHPADARARAVEPAEDPPAGRALRRRLRRPPPGPAAPVGRGARSNPRSSLAGRGRRHPSPVVVPAGVDVRAKLRLRAATVALVRQLGLDDGWPFMLLPARITKRKNIEYAIGVTRALRDLGLAPRLLVTGPPGPHNVRSVDYVDELQAERARLDVRAEVTFLYEERRPDGRFWTATDPMMDDLYQLADLLIFPSAQEGSVSRSSRPAWSVSPSSAPTSRRSARSPATASTGSPSTRRRPRPPRASPSSWRPTRPPASATRCCVDTPGSASSASASPRCSSPGVRHRVPSTEPALARYRADRLPERQPAWACAALEEPVDARRS